ncbi:MAG: hypothetical protein LBG88_00260 [Christensenellaceae bacterium]|jgi:transcription-repair coupling factor (superfamily II helicase)|nr:hypothetical protein [Christensenellaceae bacterium]
MLKIPHSKNTTITISDPDIAPVFAAWAGVTPAPKAFGRPKPFAYVTHNPLNMEHARTIFENMGLEPGIDVFVTSACLLDDKAPVLPEPVTFFQGQKITMKSAVQTIVDFGYTKTTSINSDEEFRTVGDIIDICGARVMFFGDEIEQIKPDGKFTLAPVVGKCRVEKFQTTLEILKDKVNTIILEQQNKMLVWAKGKAWKDFASEAKMTISTAPVANFFSALSVLVPEVLWNIKTRGKTVLIYTGSSHACERYLDTKGISYKVASDDNITPHAINIIHQGLGVSFELTELDTVVYSLTKASAEASSRASACQTVSPSSLENLGRLTHSLAPSEDSRSSVKTVDAAGDTSSLPDFVLPPAGGLVLHEKHGLGRYVGKKVMNLGSQEREYLVLQYDAGTFVYLPTDQAHQLYNYYGSPRRLDRI